MTKKTMEHYPAVYGVILDRVIEKGQHVVPCVDEKHARSLRATFHSYQRVVREAKPQSITMDMSEMDKERVKRDNRKLFDLQLSVNRVMARLVINNTLQEYKVSFEDKTVHGHVRAVTKSLIEAGEEKNLPDEAVFIVEEIKEELRKEGWVENPAWKRDWDV